MAKKAFISEAVIKRLPRYHRLLGQLEAENVSRVSSYDLADRLNVTASQIRQDFSNFGEFGQQGHGYNVSKLRGEIASILGLDRPHDLIVVGYGNIGRALAGYSGFRDDNFFVRAVFDVDPARLRDLPEGVEGFTMDGLPAYAASRNVDIACVCVPRSAAFGVAAVLDGLGIGRIWNFAPVDLSGVSKDIVCVNINMSDSLFVLSYYADAARRDGPESLPE